MQATDYLACCAQAFTQATQHQALGEHTVQIAGVTLCLRFVSPALMSAVLPALAHLTRTETPGPTVTIDLWDTASTSVPAPQSPFTAAEYHRYGQRAVANDGDRAIMYTPTVPMLFAYDRETRHGFCWTNDASQLTIYDRAAPLQTLLHWALREFGWQIVHAAAVGTEQGGLLLIGNTGAGKSTTALSCLAQNGLRFLSDDKCLVRIDPAPRAFAAFSSGKIKADMLDYLPQFREKMQGWDDQYKAGKGLVYLYPDYADQLIATFAIKALVIPRVAHQPRSALQPISAANAFRVFGPSTVIWLPGAEADNYRFTAELVRRVPCYQLDLALEPQYNTAAILELLTRLNG